MDYKRRVLDLLTKFSWHDDVRECLSDGTDRYAVVSEDIHDSDEHWVEGFANSWEDAAAIIASIEEGWEFVGVYDLYGEPGDEIDTITCTVIYSVSNGSSSPGQHRTTLGSDNSLPVGSRDADWAREVLGIEDEE